MPNPTLPPPDICLRVLRPTPAPMGKIAFTSTRTDNWNIWVMEADGANQRRLTSDPSIDAYPAWSPDGTTIAFQSFRTGNYEIWVMDSDGRNQQQLTNSPAADRFPAWSPDGAKIAFVSSALHTDIWIMNEDGTNQEQLTDDPATDLCLPGHPTDIKSHFHQPGLTPGIFGSWMQTVHTYSS